MAREDSISRRTVMKLAGAATATAVVAGCTGNGDDDDANGDDDDNGNGADEVEVEPGETMLLEAITSGWVGQEPAEIEGAQNPTFILQEGEEYEIGWEVGDGGVHNIEIVDDDDEVIDDLSTEDVTDEEPDDQILEFTATEEMAEYVCRPHPDAMRGPFEIVEGENGDDEEEENGDDEEEENGDDENGEDE